MDVEESLMHQVLLAAPTASSHWKDAALLESFSNVLFVIYLQSQLERLVFDQTEVSIDRL